MKWIFSAALMAVVVLAFLVLSRASELGPTSAALLIAGFLAAGLVPFASSASGLAPTSGFAARGDATRVNADSGEFETPASRLIAGTAVASSGLDDLMSPSSPSALNGGPDFNIDGVTPMVGDVDIHGNVYGVTSDDSHSWDSSFSDSNDWSSGSLHDD